MCNMLFDHLAKDLAKFETILFKLSLLIIVKNYFELSIFLLQIKRFNIILTSFQAEKSIFLITFNILRQSKHK